MADRTQHRDIEHSTAQVLSELSIEFSVQHWTSDQTAIVNVSRHGFDMTYRMAWLPHATLSELSRVDQQDRAHRLLVTGPQITSRTAEALRAAEIDYIDYAGNAHLNFGPVLVDIRGRRSPTKEPSHRPADANLFSARRMQVLFVLLAWPDFVDMPVRKIAEAAGTSVGIAQSTLEIMKESDYLIGRSLQRRDELLDLWAAAFRGALLPKIRRSSFSGSIESWSPPHGYFVSGESAVELIRQPQTLTIYVEHFDLTEAIRNGWQKSDDPNIEVRQKFWKEPNWAAPSDRHGVFTRSAAPPLMIYADLLTSSEPRQSEVARTLRRDQLVCPLRIGTQSLDLIDSVVVELISGAEADEISIMVIGAHCRDLLHTAFGRTDLLRSTSDVDIAIAVNGDAEYRRIIAALPRSGTTDIRFSIAGVAVDVVPFGDIEDPAGTTSLPGRTESLDVFGFREVFAQSIELRLPSGYRVRIPVPAGYAALKFKAWCDRSANGEYKDVGDIATVCGWYQDDADIRAALYGARTDLLIRAELDADLAALYLLGEEIADILGRVRGAELAAAWDRTDRELLAHHFARHRSRTHPDHAAANRAILALNNFLFR